MLLLRWVVSLAAALLSLLFWMRLVRAEPRFRDWVAQRFDVTISTGMKGHWKVRGASSWLSGLGLELLQLAYFMAGFVGWSLGLLLTLGLLSLLG